MMRKKMMIVWVCLVFGAGFTWADSSDVVTGGHVLSAMMTTDSASCSVSVGGSLDPKFKGADTAVDLVCQSATCPTCGNGIMVVGTTHQCNNEGCFSSVDQCTGKFAFTLFGGVDPSGNCQLPHAAAGTVCYFVAHVSSTNRQQCNGGTNSDGSDPNGTAPCSGGYCNP